MKKYAIFALVLVLTAALLTGCGCTPKDMTPTRPAVTEPILPTNIPETTVPTVPATEPATVMPTETEIPTATDDINGITDDITGTGEPSRSRMR